MNDYIIVRSKGLYKIYCARVSEGDDEVYQYTGASFAMLNDAKDFLVLRRSSEDAS